MIFLIIAITLALIALEFIKPNLGKFRLKTFSLIFYYLLVSIFSSLIDVSNENYITIVNLGFFLILSFKNIDRSMTQTVARSCALYIISALTFYLSKDLFWVFLISLFTLRVNKFSHLSFVILGSLAAFYKIYLMPRFGLSMEWIALLIVPAYYFLVTSPLKNKNHFHLYLTVYTLSQFIVSRTNSFVTSLIFILLFMSLVLKVERNNDKDSLIILLMLIVPLNENIYVLMNTYFGLIITFKMKELLISSVSELEFKDGRINNLSYLAVISIILSLVYLNGAIGSHSSWVSQYVINFNGKSGYIIYVTVSVLLMNYFIFKKYLKNGSKPQQESINDLSIALVGVIALLINTRAKNMSFLFLRPIDTLIFLIFVFLLIKKRTLVSRIVRLVNSARIAVTREIDFKDVKVEKYNKLKKPRLRPTLDLTFAGVSVTTVWSVFIFLVSLLAYLRLK